jgi:hypothetical protein
MAKHHKDEQSSVFLKWYYGCYPLFAYCCVAQEFYYLSRWALKYANPSVGGVSLEWAASTLLMPGFLMKQVNYGGSCGSFGSYEVQLAPASAAPSVEAGRGAPVLGAFWGLVELAVCLGSYVVLMVLIWFF